MSSLKQISTLIILTALALSFSACKTQKKKGDLSLMGKLYHNTTAKYNGYFNANELYLASILTLNEQHQDNYTKFLDVYEYVSVDNPQAVATDLDEAIKKLSVVVALHRQSHWTDDCYLLVGKCQYLKQDYEGAEETLRFMVEEFNPADLGSYATKSAADKKAADKKDRDQARKEREKERKEYNKKARRNKKKKPSRKKKKKVSRKKKSTRKKKEENEAEKLEEAVASVDPGTATTSNSDTPQLISISDDNGAPIQSEPDNYFMKHRPAYQEGVLWLARTLVERDNYDGARRYMAQLENNPGTFEEIKRELSVVKAYSFMKQKQYESAIQALEQAIELAKDKERKARYAYIIAQIYQKQDKGDQAYAAYDRVLDFRPNYEMEFNCKLNRAQNTWLSGKGSSEDARRSLEKMLKDIKNEPFKDQIYYALAEIALQNKDREDAIKNLRLSLSHSRQNKAQKAESYLKLARLYFEDENYVSSKYYFDSTLQVISPLDERYDEVKAYSVNLKEIAENLETIALQDSLLRISGMSEEEKKALAYEIKQKEEEARRKNVIEQANSRNKVRAVQRTPVNRAAALSKESSFFAYDDKALKRGKRDFEKKWGGRSLEDNWRRSSSKQFNDAEDDETQQDVASVPDFTEDEVNKLLGEVPKDAGQKEAANLKIKKAMFSLGTLYRERLENYEKAVEILEELNSRFPKNLHELDSWYFLYLSFNDLNNSAKAKEYKNKILENYPESTYAKILVDPNYIAEVKDKERQLNDYYDNAYADFKNGQFQSAYDKSLGVKEKFGQKNLFEPKFALLSAMCIGNLKGKKEYIEELKLVAAKYPGTEEQTQAKEMLRLLGIVSNRLPKSERGEEVGETPFKLEPEKLHYIIIAFNGDIKLNDAKIAVSDYNRKYHKLDRLRISNIYLTTSKTDRTPVLVIRRFKNMGESMKYYEGVQKNKADFVEGNSYEIFAVTQNNYRQILKTKSVNGYREFFEDNYLR